MKCPYDPRCGIECKTEAETFLHRELHRSQFGGAFGLNKLPYILMPRVAQMMHDYHEFMLLRECGEEQLEGWLCSAGFAPRMEKPK